MPVLNETGELSLPSSLQPARLDRHFVASCLPRMTEEQVARQTPIFATGGGEASASQTAGHLFSRVCYLGPCVDRGPLHF